VINIKLMSPDDQAELDILHDKYYKDDFEPTAFDTNFLSSFTIRDKHGKLIMGGGVRPIAETILVTDKSMNPHVIGDALLEALRFSKHTCRVYQIDFLHAFVKDEAYAKHLIKHGFSPRCQALYMSV
jgi:hypothetical protein